MNIHPVIMSANASAAASTSSAPGMGDMYMQLLMAQLKNQSPLEPLDPNQFVNQLAQFNTLNEIIQIRQLLQSLSLAGPAVNDSTKGGDHA